MEEQRFLQVEFDGRTYLCPENCIDRVVQVNKKDTFLSPFGPPYLKSLMCYNKEIIPLFGSGLIAEKTESSVVVIIKKLLSLTGLIVDRVKKFITMDERILADSVEVPGFLARRAIRYNGSEYYFLNIDALFEGKE